VESSSSTAERFTLSGPSLKLDTRIHAYRRDLADIALAGQLFAPHYARPLIRSCGVIATFVRSEPSDTGPIVSELLPGEQFAVLEYAGGCAWGYCVQDHIVGYVEAIELVDGPEPTHVVCEASAPIHGSGDIAAPVLARLPMASRVTGREDGPCLVTDTGCIPMSYLRPVGEHEEDAAAVAQRLFGSPYAMGGRSLHGVDDCGLIQLALSLCGLPAPRNNDQQRMLGSEIESGTHKRGDLIFFPDHVGIMTDDCLLLHASRTQAKVTVEPLTVVEDRSRSLSGEGIIARRRIG
jgi:hypothetical protein